MLKLPIVVFELYGAPIVLHNNYDNVTDTTYGHSSLAWLWGYNNVNNLYHSYYRGDSLEHTLTEP